MESTIARKDQRLELDEALGAARCRRDLIYRFAQGLEGLLPRTYADDPRNAFAMAYEICDFTLAQCDNHSDGSGSSEATREARRLLENSLRSDSVRDTALLMMAAHQKTLEACRWNMKQSDNIQRYKQKLDEWLTRDADLKSLTNHLDPGNKNFMDDDRILSHGIDRGESGSHDFILDHPYFNKWLTTGVSSVLNIVSGPGTGKTIMSARIYQRATKYASSGNMTPVLFHNCRPPRLNTSTTILRALISEIVSRRPDVLLMDDELHLEYWTTSFADASTFEKLWSIFDQLIRALHEVWIILDSVHDCDEGLDELLSCLCNLARNETTVKLKVVFTCRDADFSEMVGHFIQVKPQDLEQGARDYIHREYPELHVDLFQPALDAACRLGGGSYWAQVIMGLTKAKKDKKTAKTFLLNLRNHAQVGSCIITAVGESRRDLGLALLAILLEATLPLNLAEIIEHLGETRFSSWVNVADTDIVADYLAKYFGTVACMKDEYILLPTQKIGDISIKWARAMVEKKFRESSKAMRRVDGGEHHKVNQVGMNKQEDGSKSVRALKFLTGWFWFWKG